MGLSPPEYRRLWIAVFLLLFLTYAYGRQTPSNSNSVTRAALVVALLDEHTMRIDTYQTATCDKALCNGHYYCDKAPGMSFAALPSMALGYGLLKAAGKGEFGLVAETGDPSNAFKLLTVFGTIFTSGLCTAAAAVALGWLCLRLGCSTGGALFAALSFGLATPAWGWATAFFSHAMAGSLALFGFAGAVSLLESTSDLAHKRLRWSVIGLLLGFCVLVEYPMALVSFVIGCAILLKAAIGRRDHFGPALVGLIAGATTAAGLLMLYNYSSFGSCFQLGYHHEEGFSGMKEGFMGITFPKMDALYGILFSLRRGIFWLSPLLILTPIAFVAAFRFRNARGYLATAAIVVAGLLLLNAAYHYWDGGDSTGPRHITPALGFACFPLGFAWTLAGRKTRAVLIAFFGVSFGLSMICASVNMVSASALENPLFEELIPAFFSGRVVNLGELFGVPRYLNMVPLLVLWTVAVPVFIRILRGLKASDQATSPSACGMNK